MKNVLPSDHPTQLWLGLTVRFKIAFSNWWYETTLLRNFYFQWKSSFRLMFIVDLAYNKQCGLKKYFQTGDMSRHCLETFITDKKVFSLWWSDSTLLITNSAVLKKYFQTSDMRRHCLDIFITDEKGFSHWSSDSTLLRTFCVV